jgi:hypothetical protein
MKFGGAVNGTGAPLLGWSLLIGYAWTVVFVALRVLGKPWAIVVGFAIVLVPGGYQQAFTGYADVPMAAFIGAGTLFIGCWLRTGSVSFLSAGALLLAGAAATKNEGLLGAVVVLVAAVVVSGANLPTRRRHALIALALVGVSVLPWRIWVARHGIHGDVPFLDGLSPSYLADRTGRASLAAGRLARTAVGKDWPVIVPAAIILAGAGVASRQLRPLAAFHAIAGLAFFAVLVWIYWISTSNIHWYLSTSGSRTTTALVFIGASAVVHLSAKPSPDSSPLADEGHTSLAP